MRLWVAGIIFVILVSLAGLPQSGQVAGAGAATPGATIERGRCPFDFPQDLYVACGKLFVPENRANPASRMIALPFAIIHTVNPKPSPDPIIYTSSGGPGGGAFGAWRHLSYNFDFLAQRNIILLEQRGTRWAEPYLACPELNEAQFQSLTTTLPAEQEIAGEVQAALACRDALLAQGVDLAGYTSLESAADLEDLRLLLGIEQWNLIGTSYAARLALTVVRQYPTSLRSLVLDSVYDPAVPFMEQRAAAFANALDSLFAACAGEVGCAAAYPNLKEHFYSLLARADQQPIAVKIRHPRSGTPLTLQLSGADLALGVFNTLRSPGMLAYLPYLIEQIYAGNTAVIEPVAQNGFTGLFGNPLGMYYAIECAEEYPFNAPAAGRAASAAYPGLAGFLPTRADPAICAAWGAAPVSADFRQPVEASVPALVFSGEYDAVIAPQVSAAAASRLAGAIYIHVPGMTHAVLDFDTCARQIAGAFINSLDPQAAGLCTPGAEEISFLLPSQVVTTPLVYTLTRLLLEPYPQLAVAIAAGLALFALCALYFGARQALRQDGIPVAGGLLICASVLILIFVAGAGLLFTTADRTMLAFGLPSAFGWLIWLPVLIPMTLIGASLSSLPVRD